MIQENNTDDNISFVHDKYIVIKKLGKGKFGMVLLGKDITNEEDVAIKIEKIGNLSSIKHEVKIMNYLFQNKFRNLPKTYWYGKQDIYTCLVMSYYDCSITQWCNHNESLEIIGFSTIMYNCINILSEIHKRHVIHRDIKPQHFMMKKGELFLIDFGLATFTIDNNGEIIQDTTQTDIIGTPNYISINHHYGHKPNKRDDLISLGYMMLKLIHGNLPWEASPNIFRELPNNNSSNFINDLNHPLNIYKKDKKEWNNLIPVLETTNEKLFQLYPFIKYCYRLSYNDNPNYELLLQFFTSC